MSLDNCLDSETVSYDIEVELKIRKMLEAETDWNFEFNKNGDQYDYDIKFYRWEDNGNGELEKVHYGFVELERARKWKTGDVPDNWTYYSFLERKIQEFDHDLRKWRGPKENFRRTIYLKFNQLLDNCFAAPVVTIYNQGERTKRSDGTYNNTYRKLGFDHPDVRQGLGECVNYIDTFLAQSEDPQRRISAFLSGGNDD